MLGFKALTALALIVHSGLACPQADETQEHGHGPEWLERIKKERASSDDPDHIYVHMIAHSHDDVGWLKTVDEYFSGARQDIFKANVEMIIETVVKQLLADERKKYTQVEIKFFSMWWDEQTEEMQAKVKQLVEEERLVFINAGWSMHDEACTHYDDMVNNMQAGHEWLDKTFGYKATIGWHIDPFGHSNANPRLFADMGFDAFFIARMDYEDRAKRLANQEMQWVWRPMEDSLGDTAQIFTHTMQSTYEWPQGYWYDETTFGNRSPVVSDPNFTTFNADTKSKKLRDFILDKSGHYLGNHLMIPWGADFSYANARLTFRSEDNQIDYFNSVYDDITLIRSTPYMYLEALREQGIEWPVKTDDMFPYADQEDQYWTGYFTSRANSKSQVRFAQANIHASNKLFSEAAICQDSNSDISSLLSAKDAMMDANGILQHHDAVTGTARERVAMDYARRISKAISESNVEYLDMIQERAAREAGIQADSWQVCQAVNTTYTDCPVENAFDGSFAVAVQNPATIPQNLIRLKVPPADYTASVLVKDDWQVAQSSLLCYSYNDNTVEGTSTETCDLFVKATVDPQSLAYLKVEKSATQSGTTRKAGSGNESTSITTSAGAKLTFIEALTDEIVLEYEAKDGLTSQIAFGLEYYVPSGLPAPSGAYLFKPKTSDQLSHPYSAFVSYGVQPSQGSVDQTPIAAALIFEFSDDLGQAYQAMVRLVDDGLDLIEFDVRMLQIPVDDGEGKEVVAKWRILDNDFSNEKTFFTDSNGLEMQTRILDYRATWELQTNMKVSSNYYPINSAIAIRNQAALGDSPVLQMTVMNDRSQGGASIENGSIELMQNRRLLLDDRRGLDEPLDEVQADGLGIAVNAQYRVQLFDARDPTKSQQRRAQLVIDEPLQYFFSLDYTWDASQVSQKRDNSVQSILESFSQIGELKVHLFPEAQNQVLIRIENIADLFDGTPSATPYFDLEGYAHALYRQANPDSISKGVSVTITERSLSNSMDYSSMKKTAWKTQTQVKSVAQPEDRADEGLYALQPQRLRLFRVIYQPQGPSEQVQIETN